MMLPEESLDAALDRITHRGGKSAAGATSGGGQEDDSDDELVLSCTTVSLKCPLSGSRMKIPARYDGDL